MVIHTKFIETNWVEDLVLQKILEASERLENVVHRTPVLTSTQLNNRAGASVFVKCENFQRAGAFKFRGAYNTISQLPEDNTKYGVITHSSGNHAQAVAIAGKELGIKTVIVMPENAPQVKVNATKGYGAEVVFCKPTQEARVATVNKLIEEHGYTLVHPYDNENIIAGAATASKELLDEVGALDMIIAPVGGGGLVCGTALYSKLSGKVRTVVGAEPFGADDAFRSITSGSRILHQDPTTIADGLRTTLSERTFNYIQQYVDEIVRVSDSDIIDAMSMLMERMKIVVEPSGAAPIAAVLNIDLHPDDRVGVIISGGNLDLSRFIAQLKPLDMNGDQ